MRFYTTCFREICKQTFRVSCECISTVAAFILMLHIFYTCCYMSVKSFNIVRNLTGRISLWYLLVTFTFKNDLLILVWNRLYIHLYRELIQLSRVLFYFCSLRIFFANPSRFSTSFSASTSAVPVRTKKGRHNFGKEFVYLFFFIVKKDIHMYVRTYVDTYPILIYTDLLFQ